VESATVVAYVFLTVTLWIRALRVGSRAPLMMSFLSLLVACRELDFNSRFTSRNIEHGFTLAYFFDFKVPGKEKLVVACVLIVLFFVVYIIARNLLPPFVRALESKRTDAVMILQAAFLLAFAQPCDEMGHIFTRMRGSYTSVGLSFTVLAETLELGVSLLFVVAFFLWSSEKCEQAE